MFLFQICDKFRDVLIDMILEDVVSQTQENRTHCVAEERKVNKDLTEIWFLTEFNIQAKTDGNRKENQLLRLHNATVWLIFSPDEPQIVIGPNTYANMRATVTYSRHLSEDILQGAENSERVSKIVVKTRSGKSQSWKVISSPPVGEADVVYIVSPPNLIHKYHNYHLQYSRGKSLYIPVRKTMTCPYVKVDLIQHKVIKVTSHDPRGLTVDDVAVSDITGSELSLQEYLISEADGLQILIVCSDYYLDVIRDYTNTNSSGEFSFDQSLTVTSFVCLSISITTLSCSLGTYCLFPSLQTLPGKNNMGFLTTMLLAISLFLSGSYVTEYEAVCQVVGVATHYFLLSAFAWTLVCTGHMYYVFSDVFKHGAGRSGSDQSKTFLKYVIVSGAVPAVVVAVNILANYVINKREDCGGGTTRDIGYGSGVCYISNRYSLVLAGVLPIILTTLTNLVLYVITVRHLQALTSQQARLGREEIQRMKIYVKVSIVTGTQG